ncbi:GyrI-like domain-containing protein [Clostridium sp. UBA4548]|uniref:GyrI-like domain-containing protein n=1 Tax=Clostridium sp. UBA4548 TaxID=1946361 RepID=UPI0025C33EE3|nr:GyrI-like domain-containing protein [Clostridium sp. UBA4548]
MKFEWKNQEKNLYLPKKKPELVIVPKQKFFMISGKGNPNSEEFSEKIGILYSLAYAVRMMPRKGYTPEGYFEYTVYPLEGVWDLTEEGRQSAILKKDELLYTIMIRQPDFVTEEVVNKAFEIVRKKGSNPLLDEVTFEAMEDGLAVQMMHVGSYDEEPQSFQQMKNFIKENNLEIVTLKHREIYISDSRRTEKSKLKTVLRYQVCHK